MPGIHELLTAAVDEAARLLDADGAMVYLVDRRPATCGSPTTRASAAPQPRAGSARIELALGIGMFGRAVAERAVVSTGDYLNDQAFRHADQRRPRRRATSGSARWSWRRWSPATRSSARSARSPRGADAFDAAQIALVRALADHAAAAMANARLIEELDRSRAELGRARRDRADAARDRRRITPRRDLPSVLQLAVDEAARLLGADGARIDLLDAESGLLRWAYASGALRPDDTVWPDDPDETLEQGVSGQASSTGRAFWTGDYLNDRGSRTASGADTYIEASGIRSVMAAPLIGEAGRSGR